MTFFTSPHTSTNLPKGTYSPSKATDLRSPCPMLNALANHGYLPRDGRNINANEFMAAMDVVGVSSSLGSFFVKPCYLERKKPVTFSTLVKWSIWAQLRSLIAMIITVILNPYALFFSRNALRRPGQKDSWGRQCLDLDQLATHGVIEHDISLTRRDIAQGDNNSPQADLIKKLLASSSDGGKTLTVNDLAALRKRRIEVQKEVNPQCSYSPSQHVFACSEISLVLNILGDGRKVRHDFARAFFQEERLPIREGWKPRRWFKLGFLGLATTTIEASIKSL